ncbi:sensor domain-containing diguanylate cyclase [Mesobacillus selenatarsenatis]|uniref:COG2199 FOG GGDEF domain n=1 Tax=Mesobacillus selenatarsenatis (strain DSM 18680 / JCM 14380 / FERM P-15431 / SF-1) TaxID=1321606 RepID=A0A0A8WZB2_MESS1|nr:PAS domain S-box protein [Mesobacillus selenatarsenatis]GAM13065.1 COG2199 FOG GGDEF domain [Mesobacillus selenatarsenatis SF-1]
MMVKESGTETIIEDVAAANNLSPYFVCVHKNSIIISIDEGGTQLLGYKYQGEIIGKSIFSFLSSGNQETISTRIAAIEQGTILQGSIMSFSINGTPMDFQVNSENTIFNGESAIKTCLRFITPMSINNDYLEETGSLILSANKGIVITTPDGKIQAVSDSFTRLTGYLKENVIGRNPRIWKSHSYTPIFYKRMWDSILNKGCWEGELWNKRKDGSHYLMKVNIFSILNKDSELVNYLAVYTDLTEVEMLSQQLKEREEQFRTLVELSPNAIILSQFDKIAYANPYTEALFGANMNEVIGKSVSSFFSEHPNIASKIDFDQKSVISFEEQLKKGDSYIDIEVSSSLITYQGEKAVLTVIKEITKRKSMERALRESEEQYRFIAENSSDMIGRLSSDGIIIYISPSSRGILGYRNDELIGKNIYGKIHPDDRESLIEQYGNPKELSGIVTSSYRMLHKNGGYIWAETTVRPVKDKSGNASGMMFATRDVSARRTIENQLRESNSLLRKLSSLDGLTEIYNRRAFDEFLKTEWAFACKHKTPVSLLLLDIDYFKKYNDTYGHIQGDECLKSVARELERFFHEKGYFAARYGGEEFAVVLPNTDAQKASGLAEGFQSAIREMKIEHANSKVSEIVTISIGVSCVKPSDPEEMKQILEFADRALYKAKHNGRNRIEVCESAQNKQF